LSKNLSGDQTFQGGIKLQQFETVSTPIIIDRHSRVQSYLPADLGLLPGIKTMSGLMARLYLLFAHIHCNVHYGMSSTGDEWFVM